MTTSLESSRDHLASYLAAANDTDTAEITQMSLLVGGTLQENWRIDVTFKGGREAGVQRYVLRTNRDGAIPGATLSRPQEYAVMKAAFDVGVAVPEPLLLCEDDAVIGRDFFTMRFVEGTASPHRLVREEMLGGPHDALAERLGKEAARMQRVTADSGLLSFMPQPESGAPGAGIIAELRAYLDTQPEPHPVTEWVLRWLEVNSPPPRPLVLCHGDYRNGNFMVDDKGLTGVLDWELASWGDPLQDLSYFCMKFWRFGVTDKTAGGFADRAALYRGYEQESGRTVSPEEILYWDIMGNMRWAVISIRQAERHLSGREPDLEMCLTGRVTAEMELEAMRLIDKAEKLEANNAG